MGKRSQLPLPPSRYSTRTVKFFGPRLSLLAPRLSCRSLFVCFTLSHKCHLSYPGMRFLTAIVACTHKAIEAGLWDYRQSSEVCSFGMLNYPVIRYLPHGFRRRAVRILLGFPVCGDWTCCPLKDLTCISMERK